MLIVISAATFVLLASVLLVAQGALATRQSVSRSLNEASATTLDTWDLRSQKLAEPMTTRLLRPAWSAAGKRIRSFSPSGTMARLDEELVYAGSPRGWDGERLMAIKFLLTGLFAGTSPIWAPMIGYGGSRLLFAGPLAAFVGWYSPEWVLRSKSGERQDAIARSLPDALDLLAITVQAGLAFDGALDRVARQMHGPLSEEFMRVVQELRIGSSRADALRALKDRSNVQELKSFVLAIVQADSFGISVSTVLRVQADEIRLKRRQRAEEQAQKLPVKIVAPLMACIFPALFVVLLGPAALNIYDNILAN